MFQTEPNEKHYSVFLVFGIFEPRGFNKKTHKRKGLRVTHVSERSVMKLEGRTGGRARGCGTRLQLSFIHLFPPSAFIKFISVLKKQDKNTVLHYSHALYGSSPYAAFSLRFNLGFRDV